MSPEIGLPKPVGPEFLFTRYWVDSVVFETLPEAPKVDGDVRPTAQQYTVNLRLGSGIDGQALHAQITMTMRMEGDPKWQPYRIEVTVTGQFSAVQGTATEAQLQAFCNVNAPTILFPYIREMIERTTSDGRYGRVRLNPLNVVAHLPEKWTPVAKTDDSSGPQTPSEQ